MYALLNERNSDLVLSSRPILLAAADAIRSEEHRVIDMSSFHFVDKGYDVLTPNRTGPVFAFNENEERDERQARARLHIKE